MSTEPKDVTSGFVVDQERWNELFFDANMPLAEVIRLGLERGYIVEHKPGREN